MLMTVLCNCNNNTNNCHNKDVHNTQGADVSLCLTSSGTGEDSESEHDNETG